MGYFKKTLDSQQSIEHMDIDRALVFGAHTNESWSNQLESDNPHNWVDTKVKGTGINGMKGSIWYAIRSGCVTDFEVSTLYPTRTPFDPGEALINETLATRKTQ